MPFLVEGLTGLAYLCNERGIIRIRVDTSKLMDFDRAYVKKT